ncbi:MAG: hypothetical protein RL234_1548 [Pseudomonadota bacterium]
MNTSSAEFLASKANQDTANSHSTANAPEMIGAEMLVQALHKEGVEYVWGYPGGSVLFIYDEIFKQDKFEHILVRHEQAAVHAADGYARATGKVGVALVTSGPGVTICGNRYRCFPGSRHRWYYSPSSEAQLFG